MQQQPMVLRFAPVALALAAAFPASSIAQEVKIGGKFDAGYQFKHTAALDSASGAPGGAVTTETLGDGGASTSRITFDVKERVSDSIEAYISLDMRFGTIEEGKNAATTGGLNSNDKKVMGLKTRFGDIAWGAYNITNLQIAEKPYMTNVKDMEIVKFGVSKLTQSDLTNRVTEVVTPVLRIGPANMLLKGNYGFGDNRKSGANNDAGTVATQSSGDAWSAGYEAVWGDVKTQRATLSSVVTRRLPSSNEARDGYLSWDTGITWRPPMIDGLKLSASYFASKGYVNGPATAYAYKNTNYVVSYNYGKAWQVGVGISHANDVGSNRNSGRNIMLGGAYWLSPSVYFYGAAYKQDFERNESIANAKYDGTKAGFKDTLKKVDEHYMRFGIVKEF